MTDENLTLDDIEQDLINQVYSLDADDPKTTIAIENLSGAPDCFNNGLGLIKLNSGEEAVFETRYHIAANRP